MNEKTIYVARAVGGAVVMRMPKHTLGKYYTQTEGKDGTIYMRPAEVDCVKDEKNRKEDEAMTEANDLDVNRHIKESMDMRKDGILEVL